MVFSDNRPEDSTSDPVDVVCFGMLSNTYYVQADSIPNHNEGARITGLSDYLGDDATIISALLHEWGPTTGLICTAVGDDNSGHKLAKLISSAGVRGDVRIWDHISTEIEFCIADPSGGRTYWQQRNPAVLETLSSADLSMIKGARLLYVDWYDGDYIQRAMEEAVRQRVPVYLNIESHYDNDEILNRLAPLATICQVSMDEPRVDPRANAEKVADLLISRGISTAVITKGVGGCLVATGKEVVEMKPLSLEVVDGSGAGAVFSTGFIYSYLQGWSLERAAQFATAAASYKCSFLGLTGFTPSDIKPLAASLNPS